MSPEPSGTQLHLADVAEHLRLPTDVVAALVDVGYLRPVRDGSNGPTFALSDVKAWLARNADASPDPRLHIDLTARPPAGRIDPQDLLDALSGRVDDMARRVFEAFAMVFPEARRWTLSERADFVDQARGRFEAILAVTGQGSDVDDALVGDLEAVGAQAAWSGSPLPQLLVLLRISRDLVVQTAVELAEGQGRSSSLALSLVLTRILPAMDRLTDSLARGYWDALLGREEESLARYRGVVEQASDGVFEADLDGRISWANAGFALIVGRRLATLDGADLADVLAPVEGAGALDHLLDEEGDGTLVSLEITRADGIRRSLTVQSLRRRVDDEVVGFQGIVRDDTVQQEFEADRESFFTLVRNDIRAPLATIVGLASTLESHAEELAADQMARTGRSIRLQAEGISRLADDLHDVSQLHARSLRVSIRPVELALVVEGALASVEEAGAVRVDVEPGITVLADPRRLEQVIANLVDNALIHGAPPVTVDAEQRHDEVYLTVRDAGPGVPPERVGTMFEAVRGPTRAQQERARGQGVGLGLVRGLAEAMGGRVRYEPGGPGATFVLVLPAPARGV